MTKDDLIILLRAYKQNRYILRRNDINKDDTISALCLSASTISDMPTSVTNKFSSKTENAVMMVDDELKAQQKAIEKIRDDKENVDALLESLGNKQRLVIESFYILELTWREIAEVYQAMYKINYISKRHLQRLEDDACKRMIANAAVFDGIKKAPI